jgi:iron(III) transport system substrate-binding protein
MSAGCWLTLGRDDKEQAIMRRGNMLDRRRALLIAATLALAILPAHAQDAVDIAAAKKEGKIVWYTSTPINVGQKIVDLFQKEYGIKVEMFRSGGSAILRRFQQEMDSGRVAADVMTTSDPAAAAAMTRKGLFVPFKPKDFDKVPDAAKDPNGNYVAQRLNMMTIYLRHDKVAAADEPKTWSDVLQPKYKGQLVMTDPSFTALQVSVVAMLSKMYGWGFYEKLRANDIMVVQSNQQASDMLKRGERFIAVGALDSYAAEERQQGHPMKTLYPSDGVFVIPSPTSIIKGSPNPNAAKLFANFMLSEAVQKLFPEGGGYAARADAPPPAGAPNMKDIKILPVDYAYVEKETGRIKRRFNEILQ